MYNLRWGEGSAPRWDEPLREIFNLQQKRFKINLSHSFVLRHLERGEYRFFHASKNNARVLETPRLINNREDFERFLEEIRETDILEHARQQRPDSKWSVHSIPATSFYLNPLPDYPIGCCDHPLPAFIRNNRSILGLVSDEHNGFVYEDNLCFFRCLALYKGASTHDLQSETLRLFDRWTWGGEDFTGVSMEQLEEAESLYKVDIDVFQFDEEQTPPCLIPLRRSEGRFSSLMTILNYKQHFCYVSNIDTASHSFGCQKCGKLWRVERSLRRHQKSCTGQGVKHKYPGGVYHPAPTTLELLEQHGISLDVTFVYPFRATYDFEAYLQKEDLPKEGAQTVYTSKHVPMSVSVCSNVPGYDTPVCFVSSGDPQELINRMIDYMEEISDRSYALLKEDFADTYEQINTLKEPTRLRNALDAYLHELPIVGFNSSRYDLNLIKPYFFQRLATNKEEEEEEKSVFKFIVKNNNEYKCISTRKLRFLDITHYIAPGFSYSKYLAAFDVDERKGFFPYEYITSLDKLEETSLPPREAFFSSIKNQSISEEDYASCLRVWKELGMRTLRDFLEWYNNLDVVPFLEALGKQVAFYTTLRLDMLKDGIGVPGLTLKYLFQTLPPDVYFSLVNTKHKDLHDLLRKHTVGGPAIIFQRYAEKGITRLRGGDKTVGCLEGYDANALYLWALMQKMPTEEPTRRRKENGFRAEKTDKFGRMARGWLEWEMQSRGIHLRHKHNGKEEVLGKRRIRVDGWDVSSQTAYQFHGCLFHGHDCHLTRGRKFNPINGRSMEELRRKTEHIRDYLENTLNITLVEKWECQWMRERRENVEIDRFLSDKFPPYVSPFAEGEITLDTILSAVRSKTLFGLVQCDLEVPDELKDHFQEMTPIFKNVEVGREDAGDFMKLYAEKHRLLTRPRRTLIGSYFGKGILLATPLLRWYLKRGLVVKDVQEIIEYRPRRCFREFGKTVSDARREGDRDPTKAILAETFKLLGNSAYGKTITNLETHTNISYVDVGGVGRAINEPTFKKLTPLTEDLTEVELRKPEIYWNLPNQIGFFVYQYAKLRMLQFYYDCVDKFVDRRDFQLCEMDTDSLYMTLSSQSLEKAVRPDMRLQFYRRWKKWFPSPACDRHYDDFVESKMTGRDWNDPPPCCIDRQKLDKRTPGLFKLEYKGDGIVALCSKTYYCFGDYDKVSCKGLNKRQNDLVKDSYLQVLRTGISRGGINKSFKTDGKAIYTYHQHRNALSYFYVKRRVQPDGITTLPLLI